MGGTQPFIKAGGFKKQLKNRGSNSVLGIDAQVIAGSLAQGPPMGEAENKNNQGGGGFLRCFSELIYGGFCSLSLSGLTIVTYDIYHIIIL